MTFLKRLWRKLFCFFSGHKMSFIQNPATQDKYHQCLRCLGNYSREEAVKQGVIRPAYDPFQDEEKILKGEVESYFD